jgi:hypothetical protein
MDDGAVKRGMDRYEELTCDGEKPLTTLVVLFIDAPLAESVEAGCAERSEASADDWLSMEDVVISGMVVAGFGSSAVLASGARLNCVLRDNGSRSFFSWIVITIFSRSSGVMWRSRPRLLLFTESCRTICGRVMSRGAEVEAEV